MAPVQVELEARDTVRRLEGEALLGVQLPVVLSVFEKRSRREYFADTCCLAWQVPVAARHPGTKTPFALDQWFLRKSDLKFVRTIRFET